MHWLWFFLLDQDDSAHRLLGKCHALWLQLTLLEWHSSMVEMLKKALTRTSVKRTSKLYIWSARSGKLCYQPSPSSESQQFRFQTTLALPRPGGRLILKAVDLETSKFRRASHNASCDGVEPANEPGPGLASPTMEQGRKEFGREIAPPHATMHRAMIALGSNIGNRVKMIEEACEKMSTRGIKIKATSLLYETAPMYVTDQDAFYNGICEVRLAIWPSDVNAKTLQGRDVA